MAFVQTYHGRGAPGTFAHARSRLQARPESNPWQRNAALLEMTHADEAWMRGERPDRSPFFFSRTAEADAFVRSCPHAAIALARRTPRDLIGGRAFSRYFGA